MPTGYKELFTYSITVGSYCKSKSKDPIVCELSLFNETVTSVIVPLAILDGEFIDNIPFAPANPTHTKTNITHIAVTRFHHFIIVNMTYED